MRSSSSIPSCSSVARRRAPSSPTLPRMRDQVARMVPMMAVREQSRRVDHRRGHGAGRARHGVAAQPGRLQAVIARELRAFRLERALNAARCAPRRITAASSKWYCSAPTTPSHRFRKASWWTPTPPGSSCSASAEASGLIGQPVMDLFDGLDPCRTQGGADRLPAGTLEQPHTQGRRHCSPTARWSRSSWCWRSASTTASRGVRLIVPAQKRDERAACHRTRSGSAERSGHRPAHAPTSAARAAGAAAHRRWPAACATSSACGRTSLPRSSAI